MGKKKSRKYNWNDPNAPPRPNKQKKPATTLDYYESDSEDSLTLDNPVSYSFEDHVSDNETESNPGYVQLVKVNIRQVYNDPFSAKVRQYSKVDPSLDVVSHEARADEIDYEITLTDYEKKQRNPPRILNWAEPISRRQNREHLPHFNPRSRNFVTHSEDQIQMPRGGFRIPEEPIVLPNDEIKSEPAEDFILPHEEADTNTENWETESLGSSVWDNDEIAFG